MDNSLKTMIRRPVAAIDARTRRTPAGNPVEQRFATKFRRYGFGAVLASILPAPS
jgi:hypothetical protein